MYEISKFEFQKWVDTLDIKELSAYEITILNIIMDNYDIIAACGTAGGVRAKNIGKLISQQNNVTHTSLHSLGAVKANKKSINRLKELQVEYFRGFGVKQIFNFDKQYTFFHGPNGSGKTSFCEALEYSLLGNIEEASSRNIAIDKYIVHAGRKKAVKPFLKCIYDDGTEDESDDNFAKYRFSFIEKNRIEKFSHMGAASAKNQTERIAALFGLSEFQEFIRGFSAEIDKKYIRIESDNEEKYRKEKERIETIKENLAKEKEQLTEPQKELDTLIVSLGNPEIVNAEIAKMYLDDPKMGLISKLTNEMNNNQVELAKSDLFINLKQYCKEFGAAYKEIASNNLNILSDVQSLNLRGLYTAIVDLEETVNKECCPVCMTPMSEVRVNPFIHAKEELSKFTKIDNAKKIVKEKTKIISDRYRLIKKIVDKQEVREILREIDCNIFQDDTLDISDIEVLSPNIVEIYDTIRGILSSLDDEDAIEICIEKYNKKTIDSNLVYEKKLKEVQDVYKKIVDIDAKIKASKQNEQKWNKDLEESLPKLDEMGKLINQEKVNIAYNVNMVTAYQKIVKMLNEYISTLPLKMAENLSDKIKEYYNSINADDADFEIIKELRLPVAPNEKIMICMQDSTEQDALQILSEGHVKILGLSILLAKAIAEKSTFLIFDDIVNSIDDDHREGVAQLLITNKDFDNMQMILTCHGELFVSSLEGYVKEKNNVARYMFLPADILEERGVAIKYQDSAIPLQVAREKYQEGNLKDSAAKCRQAVEYITSKLWRKISPFIGGISVNLRNLQGRPDLYNITGALKSATKEKDIEGIKEIHEDLELLIQDRMWSLLNKGTHVDTNLPEFNRGQIKELLELVEKLAKEVDDLKVKAKVK